LALQNAYHDLYPVSDLFPIFGMHQFSQLFVQPVVQFPTTAHPRLVWSSSNQIMSHLVSSGFYSFC